MPAFAAPPGAWSKPSGNSSTFGSPVPVDARCDVMGRRRSSNRARRSWRRTVADGA